MKHTHTHTYMYMYLDNGWVNGMLHILVVIGDSLVSNHHDTRTGEREGVEEGG